MLRRTRTFGTKNVHLTFESIVAPVWQSSHICRSCLVRLCLVIAVLKRCLLMLAAMFSGPGRRIAECSRAGAPGPRGLQVYESVMNIDQISRQDFLRGML
jgi:hypothetical protein